MNESEKRTFELLASACERGVWSTKEAQDIFANVYGWRLETGEPVKDATKKKGIMKIIFESVPLQYKALAFTLGAVLGTVLMLTLLFGCGTAKADTLDTYVSTHGQTICTIIDRDGVTLHMFSDLSAAIVLDSGYSFYDTGRVIGRAVSQYCPWDYDPMVALMRRVQA